MFLARRLRVCPQAARRRYEYQFPDPSERISVEDVVLASPERTYPLAVAFLVRAKLTGANFALVMDKLQTQQEVEKILYLSNTRAMKYPLPGGFFDRTMRAFVRVGSPARALSVFLKAYENNPKAPQSQTVYLALEIAATFNAHNTATKIWTQFVEPSKTLTADISLYEPMMTLNETDLGTSIELLYKMADQDIKYIYYRRILKMLQKLSMKPKEEFLAVGSEKMQRLVLALSLVNATAERSMRSTKNDVKSWHILEQATLLAKFCKSFGMKLYQLLQHLHVNQEISEKTFNCLFAMCYEGLPIGELYQEMLAQGVLPTSETVGFMLEHLMQVHEYDQARDLLKNIDFSAFPATRKIRRFAQQLEVPLPVPDLVASTTSE